MSSTIEDRLTSRKFIATAFVLVASLPLLGSSLITSEQWVELIKWTLGLYMAGNVGAKAATTNGVGK